MGQSAQTSPDCDTQEMLAALPSMAKNEWKQAEDALKSFFYPVCINADGYEVTLVLERVGPYKNMIMVYIGGQFQGKWIAEDCEERRRFMQKKVRSLLTPKQKADYKKLSKRMQKELAQRYHNMEYETYSPQWSSFGALKKHLTTNNQSIRLIKIG
ncbi:hypothetical protein SDC9_171689 [bioreactor metagenome]|uniref:Uncharacterized protein n=1 Tax=bioreactor metagenome TaxID=1076179 RepID=A0A645GK30_9ZZZZ|nr:hypothetical protein [Oscillibacter sp.]MEA5144932.1 hypothetical protein [Candidatus Limiplasma sp.]